MINTKASKDKKYDTDNHFSKGKYTDLAIAIILSAIKENDAEFFVSCLCESCCIYIHNQELRMNEELLNYKYKNVLYKFNNKLKKII